MAKQKLIPYVHTDGTTWAHYFVDADSGVIYFLKSHNGKKIKFSCRTNNGLKAKRFANAEFDKRTGKTARHVRTLIKDELAAWHQLKESEGLNTYTLYSIRRAKNHIDEFWGDKLPSEINRDTFAEWCLYWPSAHPEIEMENAVKWFNNFCRYLHEKVVNDRPLLASLMRFQDPNRNRVRAERAKKKERVFTHAEFKRIHDTAANPDEALIVHFMYTMATRIDETLNLDFGGRILLDTNPPLFRWNVGTNKAKRTGEHVLHPTLIEPLRALRARRLAEGTDLLFPQERNNQKPLKPQQIDWAGWRARADIGFHWSAHLFRHTALTELFNNPANPQAVICKLYRTNLKTALETYVKVNREAMLSVGQSIKVAI